MNHRYALFTAALLPALAAPAMADIVNGDFEAGNTGFSSTHQYFAVSQSPNINQYGIAHSSFEWSQFWGTIPGDHTTGHGLFMIVDVGSTNTIWQQTVAVNPGSTYSLGAWLANWTSFASTTLAIEINGQQIATWGPPGSAAWTQYTASWNSGAATSATIRFHAASYFQPGDDIAIDDITFTPAPGAAAVFGLGAVGLMRRRR
ncbi:MAG: hypothetical protein QM783_14690 [Phycisphaerales bacterium]